MDDNRRGLTRIWLAGDPVTGIDAITRQSFQRRSSLRRSSGLVQMPPQQKAVVVRHVPAQAGEAASPGGARKRPVVCARSRSGSADRSDVDGGRHKAMPQLVAALRARDQQLGLSVDVEKVA